MEKQTIYTALVQPGSGYAAKIGFPTVNIPLDDKAVSGIYAARVTLQNGEESHMAAVYADPKRRVLEAHLLDFSGDLYGARISIELLKKIRDDEVFSDEAALKAAIAADVEKAREYFTR